ncbi:pentapeptide repeat-containing protein [Kiloniella laminariae]|uniref:pentapeptide repeat-containing protein n=1 Tax=Kiloniella laminariae TaxID=454162 RepID=UPI000374CA17|nr:pentapeptide repeat-containing protein [Kiloniella laminariae]
MRYKFKRLRHADTNLASSAVRKVAVSANGEGPSRLNRFFQTLGRIELLFGFIAIPVVSIVGWNEIQSIAEQRRVNAWQLVVTEASGNSGKGAALEFLNQQHYCIPWTNTCLLEKEPLVGINLENGYIPDVNLSRANLDNVVMNGAYLLQADLSRTRLEKANFLKAYLVLSDLTDAFLKDASFNQANLAFVNFSKAYLENVDFSGANLKGARFEDTDLRGIHAIDEKFHNAVFTDANLSFTDFTGSNLIVEQLENTCVMAVDAQPVLPDRVEFKDIKLEVCERYKTE